MDVIEIPERLHLSDLATNEGDPVATAEFIMTGLLHRLPAMLYAEFQDQEVRWYVRDAEKHEECIVRSETIGEFRGLLAHFGHHYMGGQHYGGHVRQTVAQNGHKFACEIFMSNHGLTGFWIRVYARAI